MTEEKQPETVVKKPHGKRGKSKKTIALERARANEARRIARAEFARTQPLAKKEYQPAEKLGALAALEFLNGNLSQTARLLGISVVSLKTWRTETLEGAVFVEDSEQQDDGVSRILKMLHKFLEVLCAITLKNLNTANMGEVHSLIGVISDRIARLEVVAEARKPKPVETPAAALPVASKPTGPRIEELSEEDKAEQQRWESIVQLIMQESDVSRAAAVKQLIKDKPEARRFLKVTAPTFDEFEIEGGVS